MLGMLMAVAVCGIRTYLIMNPSEQDAIEYPEMCRHNHTSFNKNETGIE
jgi:hypothetical protein